MRLAPSLALLLAIAPLAGQEATKEITTSREVRGRYQVIFTHTIVAEPNGQLELRDLRGDVVITGVDGKQMVIVERIRLPVFSGGRSEQVAIEISGWLERIPADPAVYTFRTDRNRRRDISLSYSIKIPKVFNVYIRSFGGDIDLSELRGELNLKTGGGDISIAGTMGRIMIKTSGGDIDVFKASGTLDLVTSGGDIEGRKLEGNIYVKTGGGDIELIDSKGKLNSETGGGDIELRGFSGEKIRARTGGGDIELSRITATVNLMTGGGDVDVADLTGDLEVASGGGDISLRRTTGDMVLFTNHGDIIARHVHGALRARSGSGDIIVTDWNISATSKKTSLLETRNGDIRLELADHTAVEFTLTVLDTPPRYGMKQIYGNVDFSISREGGNTIGWYKPEKPLHTIELETREGSISIMQPED